MSIYREYRPSTFDELIAQDQVVSVLRGAASEGRIGHAYLFSGPRGVGKTTTARLIAKLVNCEERILNEEFSKKGNPCNECSICKEIDAGHALDVIEIDAASNRGIDEIRSLKESVRLAPSRLKNKVYIIDEAHMLTKEAFNALLKTLEEPPDRTVFILATTETEKIPATIVSRVQHFHFRRIPRERIVGKLQLIAKAEGLETDMDALDLIASSAEGGMRDAESFLERFIAFNEKKISVPDVERAMGKVGFRRISDFAGTLLKRDLDNVLRMLLQINEEGHNLVQFTKDLIQYMRRTAVIRYSSAASEMFRSELMEEHVEQLVAHSQLFDEGSIKTLKNLIQAYGQMRYSPFPIIPLEIAIIESLK